MNTDLIRIGRVSSYDEATGTASIYYPDRGATATDTFPVYSPNGTKQILKKDQLVLVAHLSDDANAAVVLGGFSALGNVPGTVVTADNGFSVATGGSVSINSSGSASISSSGTLNLTGDGKSTTVGEIKDAVDKIEDMDEEVTSCTSQVSALQETVSSIDAIQDETINALE